MSRLMTNDTFIRSRSLLELEVGQKDSEIIHKLRNRWRTLILDLVNFEVVQAHRYADLRLSLLDRLRDDAENEASEAGGDSPLASDSEDRIGGLQDPKVFLRELEMDAAGPRCVVRGWARIVRDGVHVLSTDLDSEVPVGPHERVFVTIHFGRKARVGHIWFDDGEMSWPEDTFLTESKPHIAMEVYTTVEAFDRVGGATLAGSSAALQVEVQAVLWEDDMQASFSEPWMSNRYTLVTTPGKHSSEYCVLGEICWRTRMVSPDRNGLADQQSGANDASPSNTVTEIGSLQHIERKLTYMLGLLAIIALALFIK